MIYKGLYHFFYQYNPFGAAWGNIVWAHSTSVDLVNWIPHDPAIYPSQQADINGCWSGSATILPGEKPVFLYTGVDSKSQQVQNIAVPKNMSDPFLVEWVKSPKNPLMEPTSMNKVNASSFRDPTTAWLGPDRRWRVIIGSKRGRQGLAILYRSKDFINWVKAKHPLHSAKGTGMWECPDFFPVSTSNQSGLDTSMVGLGIKHVLKLSLDDTKHDYYTVGTYNLAMDRYIPDSGSVDGDSGLRYDYGKFYASKTFYDNVKNRRVLWGWINESLSEVDYVKQGWAGVQAIPRSVWLAKSGKQLVQWPIVEIEKLRTNRVDSPSTDLKGGSVHEISGVTAAQADVEISFRVSEFNKADVMDPSWTNPQLLCSQKGASVKGGLGPFGLLVLASNHLQEYTAVFFRIFKGQNKYVVLMCSDQSRSSLNKNPDKTTYGAFVDVDPIKEKLSLRSLIDHSIVESFGGDGKVCISSRVYPTLAIEGGAHLYAFNNGTQGVTISKLSAWSMTKAQIS
ncbi:beta-fructofuranosidase, insoluble isoenzyme CWINV1-like [Cornus florida]|uniref:beta-fructofuranosidase, insoluble isoenzyme CWINV1-like n=1 Tax=Cornus florida TaxID=4283 RepID=UPI0028966FA3|nr:beta-fructofuranosidase, insoluble isoenzyme CWINV1-like [Cornus florida]